MQSPERGTAQAVAPRPGKTKVRAVAKANSNRPTVWS